MNLTSSNIPLTKGEIMLRKKSRVTKLLGQIGVLTVTLFSFAWSQLVTEDFLSNPGFELEDNLGLPVDWAQAGNAEAKGIIYKVDKETKKVGDGALMVTVAEDGNTADGLINQGLMTFPFGEEKLYCRAWVKYKDVSSAFGFQLVIHQAKRNPSAPFWEEIGGWKNWYAGAGSVDEWTQVEGEVDLLSNANAGIFRVYLRKGMFPGCTVWVDNIEISTEPLPPPGPITDVNNNISAKERNTMLSINGNQVQFNSPTNYQMKIYSPNGQQIVSQSGFGTKVDLPNKKMATGCYIVKIQSDVGNLTKSFTINSR